MLSNAAVTSRAGPAVVRLAPASTPRSGPGCAVRRICLLGGFRLMVGAEVVSVSAGSQRLVAFVALHGQPVLRSVVAGTLWPDVVESRAYASLRSALRRLTGATKDALTVDPVHIGLAPNVGVDLHEIRATVRRILKSAPPSGDECPADEATVAGLSRDLLPGWYDDWVLLEAEDWRLLRLQALEKLAAEFTTARRFPDAIAAAGAAVRAEPLRESAHIALITAHLTEGNHADALKIFERYRLLLRTELGLAPTAALLGLVAGLHRHAAVTPPVPPSSRRP
jgi:SARP family transcriptional regulator, regulator of embCAB operon